MRGLHPLLGDGLEPIDRLRVSTEDWLLRRSHRDRSAVARWYCWPAATTELVAFLRLRGLPSIDEILLNPDTAPLLSEPSAQIAITSA